ncbi:hypothetical protein [Brevibacillus choshinensis]|uniref:hypothetical protein n=1 Tax=Brevibacillus choshinensis TaxID=54911 RepID=UPI002E1DEBD1|nr:hypothetical protein [Brevibacillus choshinensis]
MKNVGIIRICLAATVLLTGCQFWQTNQSTTKQLPAPPDPVISWKGQSAVTIPTSSCWHYEDQGVCTDTAAPPEIVGEKKPKALSVQPGATLTVTFPQPPIEKSLRVTQWLGIDQIEQLLENGNEWKAPKEPGWYLFDVRGQWDQGDAGHAFVIEVREPRL